MKIGDIELPIVSEIETREEAEVTEIKDGFKTIDSVAVKHEASVDTLEISGYLNKEMHSQDYSLDKQKEELKKLRKNETKDNDFDYLDFRGHLLIESVSFSDNSDSRIVTEVDIESRYFPWPKYYPDTTW